MNDKKRIRLEHIKELEKESKIQDVKLTELNECIEVK